MTFYIFISIISIYSTYTKICYFYIAIFVKSALFLRRLGGACRSGAEPGRVGQFRERRQAAGNEGKGGRRCKKKGSKSFHIPNPQIRFSGIYFAFHPLSCQGGKGEKPLCPCAGMKKRIY